jgi:PAS domain S-box-containing protein
VVQKVKELEILRSIGKLITSLLDLDELLARIVEASVDIAGAEEGYLLLVDEGTGELYLRAGQNLGEEHAQGFRVKVHDSIAGSVVKTGKPEIAKSKEGKSLRIKTGYQVKALLNVPLKVRGRVIGVLGVNNKVSDKAFSKDNLHMLSILADYAAIAIENAQLFEDAKQRARNLVTLQDLALTISSSLDLDETLRKACQAAVELFNADHSGLVLFDPSYVEGKVRAEYPALGTLDTTIPLRGVPAEERLIETKEPLTISDVASNKSLGPVRDILGEFDIRSILIVPVVFKGRVLGSFSLDTTSRLHTFTENEVDLSNIFAAQVAVAIENARLYTSMERQAERLRILHEIGKEMVSALELERLLGSIAEHIVRLVGARKSLFLLVDKKRGCLIKAAGYGYPPEHLQRLTFEEVETGVSGWVLRTGKPTLVADAQSDPRNTGVALERAKQFDTVPLVVAPLVVKGEVIGTLTAVNTADDPVFTEHDLNMAVMLANQAAIAIENARLFFQLSETKERLNGLIASSLDAVIAIDQDKKITVFNRRAEEMFGWTAEEMIGQGVARLYVDFGKAQEIYEVVNREGTIAGWEILLKHKDGTKIPALLSATLIRDSKGNPIGQAGFMRDLRQMYLLEERLRALIGVSQAITGILELDKVLDLIVASTVTAFPRAQSGTIHLYDERADTLRVRAITFDYSAEALEALSLRSGEGIAGWVFQNQQRLVVNDTRKDPRYKQIDHPEVQVHRSMICVPLRARERVIGTLSLNNSDTTGAFQPEDLGLLASFADQAAIAIDNAQRMQELEQIRQAAEAMSRVFEPRQALQQIVESAAQILQVNSAVIWSYDEVRHSFVPEQLVAVGIPPDELERFRKEKPKPGQTAETVMHEGYVTVTDISQPEYDFLGQSTRELLNRIGVRSFQGIVLEVGDERLGVLYANYNRTRTFGKNDEARLRTFASHAALALKNARLMVQMQRTREAAGVIAGVTVHEDLEQTLKTIVQHTQRVLHSDAVTLYSYDEYAGQFGEWATDIIDARDPDSARRPEKLDPDSAVGTILRLEGPPYYHLAEDHADQDRLLAGGFVHTEGIKAAIGVQLRVGERKVGVMFVNFRSPHRFTSDEIATIQLFADQAAVAIGNARLYEREEHRAREAEAMVQVGQAISSTLDLNRTLQTVAENALSLLGLELEDGNSTIFLVDEKTGNFVRSARVPPCKGGNGPRPSGGLTSLVVETGKPVVISDVRRDSRVRASVVESGVRSVIGMPLKVKERTIGVLFANTLCPRDFTQRDIEMLSSLANQAAVAIENACLYEKQQQEAKQLAVINQIAAEIGSSLDLDKILQTLVNELARVIGVEQCAIAVSDERGEYADVVAEYLEEGCVPSKAVSQRVPVRGNPAIELVRRTRKPLAVKDAQRDPCMEKVWDIMKQRRTQSIMIVPIFIGDELIGTIGLDAVSGPRDFTREEEWLAETIAYHAAIAIQNARQFRLREGLLKAGEVVTAEGELYPALEVIAQSVKETIGCDVVSLYTYDREKREISYPAVLVGELHKPQEQADWQFVSQEKRLQMDLLGEHSVIRKLLKHGFSRFAFCSTEDPILGTGNFVVREGIESSAGILLKIGEEVVGILFVNYRSAHRFSDEEKRAAELFAVQAALTIQSARRYEELKKIKGFVGARTAIDWMRMVSTAWGHGIRREVGTALGHMALLRGLLTKGESAQEVEKELDQLENVIKGIKEIPITAPLSYEDAVDSVQINELVKTYLERQWKHVRYRSVKLYYDLQEDLDSIATVRASRQWLRRALEILVDNSVQAMLEVDSPEKRLTVTTQLVGKTVEISVKDTGPGIPKDVLEKLFEEPIDKPVGSRGAGIGLMLAQTIVQTHGGDISVGPPADKGTNMVIVLPIEN